MGKPVANGDVLKGLRSGILPFGKECPELVSDLSGDGDGLHLNLVASDAILALAGDVLDEDDLDLATEELEEKLTNKPLGLILPDFGVAFWNVRQTKDNEMIFIPDIFLEVGKFCIFGVLVLDNLVQSTMVLF